MKKIRSMSKILILILTLSLLITFPLTVLAADDSSARYVHNFTESGKDSTFYNITGSLSTTKGTVSYDGLTLTQCLKMESSTNISFDAPADGTLTLVFVENTPTAKVDGNKVTGSDCVISIELTAGSHSVTKADTMNLFYIVYTPAGGAVDPDDGAHTHSYTSEVTTPATCTAPGVKTYTCECDESYTEEIAIVSHDYVDGVCSMCGAAIPSISEYVHNFTESDTTSTFYTIKGNLATKNGTVTYNGLNLTRCLKMESSTEISFTAPAGGTLILVFGGTTDASGKKVKIDGENHTVPETQILEVSLSEGSHNVTKGDTMNLFYVVFAIEGSVHRHSYASTVIAPATCTETGLRKYTCECDESYTEVIPTLPHNYLSSITTPATCTDPGVRTYTCECGESYTEEIRTISHVYVDGVCSMCGIDKPADSGYTHCFTEQGKESQFYTITGNLSTDKGTMIFNEEVLTQCLKMESVTEISFTSENGGTIFLVFIEEKPTVQIDGVRYTGDDFVIIEDVSAGTHKITKADTMNLFHMVYLPEGEARSHGYVAHLATAPTCTSEGVYEHICYSCRDTYTTPIPREKHVFLGDTCIMCDGRKRSFVHNFTDDGFTSVFFKVQGSKVTADSNGLYKHGTYVYDFGHGEEILNNSLKLDSGGRITFIPMDDGTLTIAAAALAGGRTFLINGEAVAIPNAMELVVVTINVIGNAEYVITYGNEESAIFYLEYFTETEDEEDDINPPSTTPDLPGFSGASLSVGSDLSIRYHIVPEEGRTIDEYAVRFTMNGKETLVTSGIFENNKFIFSFCGIAPQYMDESIRAELLINGEVVDVIESFSVKQYVLKVFQYYSTKEYVVLRQFLSDMLRYGAESQKYIDYNANKLVTSDANGILASSGYTPTDSDKNRSLTTVAGASTTHAAFTAAGVRFDYNNRIFVKFRSDDIDNVKIMVGGEEIDIYSSDNGVYIAYSEGISALHFADVVTFELYYGGEHIQTLSYTVNTYAWDKLGNAEIGDLTLALYRYGQSAIAYHNNRNS